MPSFAPMALPSHLLSRTLGHRGLLHSLVGMAAMTVLVAVAVGFWLGWQPAVALTLGYASHLLLDACTRTGVPLLYPDRTRRFVLPFRWRITTGAPEEGICFALVAAFTLALLLTLLLSGQPSTGYEEGRPPTTELGAAPLAPGL